MTPPVQSTAATSPRPWAAPSASGAGGNTTLSVRSLALAAVASLAIWWGSTAILIFFNFIPGARPFVFLTSMAVAAVSLRWLYRNQDNRSVSGAYLGFTAGLMVWAFVEVSFYTGYIVGPDLPLAEVTGPTWSSFFGAIQTSLYHEVMVLAMGVVGFATLRKGENRFGLYVFLILLFFHQSAKLNVFLGVVNTGSHFLPETVSGLEPYMTTAGMNFLFPVSVTINTVVAAHLLRKGVSRTVIPWRRVGYILVGTMAALALAEHWFLILPMEGTLFDVSLGHTH